MFYKECMTRFRQSKAIKKGERGRETLESENLEEEEAITLWREAKKAITDTRTRDFFYRLINELLFANQDLHRFSIKQSGICTECDKQYQIVQHLP